MITRSGRVAIAVLVLGAPLCMSLALERAAGQTQPSPIKFADARAQSAEFIGYNRSIQLTAEQQKVRDAALSAMPAACCDKFSQATCCCPCNLVKTVWGLSNYLIARRHAGVAEVQAAARGWLKFVNKKGFTGDICDAPGGCLRSFADDGCGGMDEGKLAVSR